MTTTAVSNYMYHTIHTLPTTLQSTSMKRALLNPTAVEVHSTPTAMPTATKPRPTTRTSLSINHTGLASITIISPTVTKQRWATTTTAWMSAQDVSTVTEMEKGTTRTAPDNTTAVTLIPDGQPPNNETLDTTHNTGVFFGEARNATAVSVAALMIIVTVIVLVTFFFMLKRYRKKRAYSVHHRPAYTNPVIENINVTVNLGAENCSAASQSESEQTAPPTSANDLIQPPRYEQEDQTYMHLYSEPSLSAADTEYTTIINTRALEDSGYYEIPIKSNNS